MEKDDETGLSYHHHRHYAVWLGRWCSSDPIGLGGGINRWAYCSGGPVGAADPAGHNLILAFVSWLQSSGRNDDKPAPEGRVEALSDEVEVVGIMIPKTAEDLAWEEALAGLAEDKGGPYIVAAHDMAASHFDQPPPDRFEDFGKYNELHASVNSGGPAAAALPIAAALGGGDLDEMVVASRVGSALDVGLATAAARSAGRLSAQGVDVSPSLRGRAVDSVPSRTGVAASTHDGESRRGTLHNDYDPHGPRDPDFYVTVGPDSGSLRFATGDLVGRGVLVLSIDSAQARAQGHSDASGGFAFQSIVRAAAGTGELQAIRGIWVEGDNLAAFRAAGGGPGSTKAANTAAARSTWTADQAAKAGFTEIEVESVTNNMVRVRFSRPGG